MLSNTSASQATSDAGPATPAAIAGRVMTPVPRTAPTDNAVPCGTDSPDSRPLRAAEGGGVGMEAEAEAGAGVDMVRSSARIGPAHRATTGRTDWSNLGWRRGPPPFPRRPGPCHG